MQFRIRLRFGLADLRLACDVSLALTARAAISQPCDDDEPPADHSAASASVERRLAAAPAIAGPVDPDAKPRSSYGESTET
jgi:hypothetical protein